MRCLLVVPAHRDRARLSGFLRDLVTTLDQDDRSCEVLVVDDGSGPEEQRHLVKLVREIRSESPRLLQPLCLIRHRGKGRAIRAGWERAGEHDWLAFVDADGSVPAAEVSRLVALALANSQRPALFGARTQTPGRRIERKRRRHLAARLFTTLVNWYISAGIHDSQCGVKFVPAEHYRRIAPWLTEEGLSFDLELLAALSANGCAVQEVPIEWEDRPGRKGSLLRDGPALVLGIHRIHRHVRTWSTATSRGIDPDGHAEIAPSGLGCAPRI